MHLIIDKALGCACLMLVVISLPSAAENSVLQRLPQSPALSDGTKTNWKHANKKVAELGGWQFYMQEAGGHDAMDHSKHSDHSTHQMPAMDHSKHEAPAAPKVQRKDGGQHEHHH